MRVYHYHQLAGIWGAPAEIPEDGRLYYDHKVGNRKDTYVGIYSTPGLSPRIATISPPPLFPKKAPVAIERLPGFPATLYTRLMQEKRKMLEKKTKSNRTKSSSL